MTHIVCTNRFLIAVFFLFASPAWAKFSIPQGLSNGDQELILQTAGFGTSFRSVDNPYPLGGYSGVEIGVGYDTLSLGQYFAKSANVESATSYPRLTIGKGVYGGFDLFFSFIPYNDQTGIGIYSGAVRWGFFQATFVPACFSLLVNATSTDIGNVFFSQTLGVDLISGVNVDAFSLYVGAGTMYGQGQFDPTVSADGSKHNQVARSFHTLIGVNIAISQAFTAFQLDNYNTTTYSFMMGTRF